MMGGIGFNFTLLEKANQKIDNIFITQYIMEDYSLAGHPWPCIEDNQLIKEYTIDKLTIMQLSKLHKRMPGGIISRLYALKLIDKRDNAHGYLEYKESDLYKEICRNKKENRKISKETKITAVVNAEIDNLEITLLKKDVNELKKDVKEILRLMNALYDFEASQGNS